MINMAKQKKLFGLFDMSPMNLAHYALDIVLLFAWFWIGNNYLNLTTYGNFQMGIFWFVGLFLADSITHKILKFD